MTYRISLITSSIARMKELRSYLNQQANLEILYWQEDDPIWTDLPAGNDIDGFILDLPWDSGESLRKLSSLHYQQPHIPILALIPYNHSNLAEVIMEHGASDYLLAPLFANQLNVRIRSLLRQKELQEEVKRLSAYKFPVLHLEDISPISNELKKVRETSLNMAKSDVPLAICGRDGVGREMFGRAIHNSSSRRYGPLVCVNLHHMSEHDISLRLFGNDEHSGEARRACEGTLMVRGMESAPVSVYAQLAALYQDGQGTGRLIFIVDMEDENQPLPSKYQCFKDPSLARLHIPQLYVMKNDVASLASFMCKRFAMMEGRQIESIDAEAMELLEEHEWPGNLREFSEAMFKAVMTCHERTLTIKDFGHILFADGVKYKMTTPATSHAVSAGISRDDAKKALYVQEDGTLKPLDDLEKELISFAMDYCDGHISQAARYLGIGRSTLYRKLSDN